MMASFSTPNLTANFGAQQQQEQRRLGLRRRQRLLRRPQQLFLLLLVLTLLRLGTDEDPAAMWGFVQSFSPTVVRPHARQQHHQQQQQRRRRQPWRNTISSSYSPSFSFLWGLSAATTEGSASFSITTTTTTTDPDTTTDTLATPTPTTTTLTSTPVSTLAIQTRSDFPILSHPLMNDSNNNKDQDYPLIYMDSAATSQKPTMVLDALNHYYRTSNANVHRGSHTLSRQATAAYEAARDTVAEFLHATSRNEVIFTSGATEALNVLVQSIRQRLSQHNNNNNNKNEPMEIVLTVAEHHANLVPWQMLAKEDSRYKIKFVPLTADQTVVDWSQLDSLLHPTRTKVVSFQHVSNVLATVNPVKELVAFIRLRCPDAIIIVDACQSVPHMPINVQDLGMDFLVASGHKLCGPTGIGILWGRQALLQHWPPAKGGGEMIDCVSLHQAPTFLPPPARFEAGTPPIAQAIGLAAAMDYLTTNVAGGMTAIEQYEAQLGRYLYQQLSMVPGIHILGPAPPVTPPTTTMTREASSSFNNNNNDDDKPQFPPVYRGAALTAFVHESIHPADLSAMLDTYGVAVRSGHHCCQPLHQEALASILFGYSHSVRASLAFYNTFEEIDLFVKYLKEVIAFFEDMKKVPSASSSPISSPPEGQEDDSEDNDSNSVDGFVPFV